MFWEIVERMNLFSEELDIMFMVLDSDGDGIIIYSDLICEFFCLNSILVYCKFDMFENYKYFFKDIVLDFRVLFMEWLVKLIV